MKTLLKMLIMSAVLLTATISYGQADKWVDLDTLYQTDTIKSAELEGKYLYLIVSANAIDTGSGGLATPDTVAVEYYEPTLKVWLACQLRELSEFSDYDRIVLITGEIKSYLVLNPNVWALRVRLTNTDNTDKRVKVSLMGKTY